MHNQWLVTLLQNLIAWFPTVIIELLSMFLVSEPIHPPPALSTGSPHILEFSKDMSYERLAEWLTNLVGDGYQQDIRKLRGIILLL